MTDTTGCHTTTIAAKTSQAMALLIRLVHRTREDLPMRFRLCESLCKTPEQEDELSASVARRAESTMIALHNGTPLPSWQLVEATYAKNMVMWSDPALWADKYQRLTRSEAWLMLTRDFECTSKELYQIGVTLTVFSAHILNQASEKP